MVFPKSKYANTSSHNFNYFTNLAAAKNKSMQIANANNTNALKRTKLELLNQIFENWSGSKALSINKLPASGSKREYYRITGNKHVAIGAINEDAAENLAFIGFTKHFLNLGLPVPEIYQTDLENHIYLLEDLGDTTLFNFLLEHRISTDFPKELFEIYKQVLHELPKFQITGSKHFNYSICYPRSSFDRQSMQWDLSYFKYYFLKLADIPFNEQLLEDDFNTLIDFLQSADCNYFVYRDFQSRNIMVQNHKLYFIDYQGGRKGALQYDVASLLYDAKADIPQSIREELLEYYMEQIKTYQTIDTEKFKEYYYGYVLIRIMQAMGAYGFRGFYEKKSHFLQSIPYALQNLAWIIQNVKLPIQIPVLNEVFKLLIHSEKLIKFKPKENRKSALSVSISSFAYKNGIPEDSSGNGGGYVFDCRTIHNPGRYDQFKPFTGKDKAVIEFFEKETEAEKYLSHVFSLVDMSVDTYRERNFTNLMVSFGCTGGQHRSVYCAERMAEHLRQKYSIDVSLWHREQD
jgi:aminoglycoside/choline kinase family phosphotransferase